MVIVLLIGLNMVSTPILQPNANHSLPIHKILYLDRNFSENEIEIITEAALEWHYESGNLVTFNVMKMPARNINTDDAIFITIVNQDFPEIIGLDNAAPDACHLGYYDQIHGMSYIALVPFRIESKIYKMVIMHELGHALDLKHNEGIEGVGTLMYPNVELGVDYVTDTDLQHLCELYGCNPKKLHY